MDKLKSIINSVRAGKGEPAIDEISEEMDLRVDVGLDSLDLAELTVRIEEEFGVDVFEDGLVVTIGEIVEKING